MRIIVIAIIVVSITIPQYPTTVPYRLQKCVLYCAVMTHLFYTPALQVSDPNPTRGPRTSSAMT